jgi:hypothetical protein
MSTPVPTRNERRAKLAQLAAVRQERDRKVGAQSPGATPFARRTNKIPPGNPAPGNASGRRGRKDIRTPPCIFCMDNH